MCLHHNNANLPQIAVGQSFHNEQCLKCWNVAFGTNADRGNSRERKSPSGIILDMNCSIVPGQYLFATTSTGIHGALPLGTLRNLYADFACYFRDSLQWSQSHEEPMRAGSLELGLAEVIWLSALDSQYPITLRIVLWLFAWLATSSK